MIPVNLRALPENHPYRNQPIRKIPNLRCINKFSKSKQKPQSWKIGKSTFNELGETWTEHNDWIIE